MKLISTNVNKVFLCKNSKIFKKDRVDIILSPEFYWVRIFDIPVANESHARRVLPTLFEDIIDNTKQYSYKLIKLKENNYLCFAYEDKNIIEGIKNSGLNISSINNIYFAQTECYDYDTFEVDGNSFLYTKEKVLVKAPDGLLNDTENLKTKLSSISLSSNKIDLRLYNKLLSTKQIVFIAICSIVIAALNLYKIYEYKSETNKIESKIELEKNKNKLPKSMIQTNSIISKYKKVYNIEVEKREALGYIIANKTLKLKNLYLEKNFLNLNFENQDKAYVEDFLSKKYKIIDSRFQDLTLSIRVEL